MTNIFDKNLSKYFTEDELSVAGIYAKKVDGKYVGDLLIEKLLSKHSEKECLKLLKSIVTTYYEFGDTKVKELIDRTIQSYR